MAWEVPFAFGCLATTDPTSGLITWAYKTHPLEIGDIARRSEPVGVLSIDTAGRPDPLPTVSRVPRAAMLNASSTRRSRGH